MTRVARAVAARIEELATAVWIVCVLCWVVLLFVAQAARAADFPAVGAGTLLYRSIGGVYASTPPLSTDMRVSIAGVVARYPSSRRSRTTAASSARRCTRCRCPTMRPSTGSR